MFSSWHLEVSKIILALAKDISKISFSVKSIKILMSSLETFEDLKKLYSSCAVITAVKVELRCYKLVIKHL